MIRAESCQFGKNLYMYPGERAADTLKQTELPLSFNDRVKTKDVMRSSVPANGGKRAQNLRCVEGRGIYPISGILISRKAYFCCRSQETSL